MADASREQPDGGASECRALVVVDRSRPAPVDERPLASFVAQLIACRARVPAYRRTMRVAPADAQESYRPPAARPSARSFDSVA